MKNKKCWFCGGKIFYELGGARKIGRIKIARMQCNQCGDISIRLSIIRVQQKKIPLSCRLRLKLLCKSPSAFMWTCKLGVKRRFYEKCSNCEYSILREIRSLKNESN